MVAESYSSAFSVSPGNNVVAIFAQNGNGYKVKINGVEKGYVVSILIDKSQTFYLVDGAYYSFSSSIQIDVRTGGLGLVLKQTQL